MENDDKVGLTRRVARLEVLMQEAVDAKMKASEAKNDALRADTAATQERLLAAIAEQGRAVAEHGRAMAEQSKVTAERAAEQGRVAAERAAEQGRVAAERAAEQSKAAAEQGKDIIKTIVLSVGVAATLLGVVISLALSGSRPVIIHYPPALPATQAPVEPVAKTGNGTEEND